MSFSSEGSRFSSVGDSLFEERFDPAQRAQFAAKLKQADAQPAAVPQKIVVVFRSAFEPKVKEALDSVTEACFEIACGYGLRIKQQLPSVEFYGPVDWEQKSGESTSSIELPAARLDNEGSRPIVQIIAPLKIKTTDGVIKAVRLLCSKVFGELFFREQVEHRPPFSLMQTNIKEISFDFNEKLFFIRFLENYPPSLIQAFDQEALTQGFRGPKARERGQKELFRILFEAPEERSALAQVINETFEATLKELQNDPDQYFEQLVNRLDRLLPRGGLILPHEKAHFDFFKQNKQWNLFHALEERLQFVVGFIKELDEAFVWLSRVQSQELEFDAELSTAWRRTIKERNVQLKKRGWVKLFLMDQAQLNQKQEGDRSRFPLWLWQRGLLDHLPKGAKAEQIIKHLSDQYQHSVYAKLYEFGFRISQQLQGFESKGLVTGFSDSPRMKGLHTSLDLLCQNIEDLLNTSRIAYRLSSVVNPQKVDKTTILGCYREGWSYFISFALIHQFYLAKKSPNAPKFLKAIESYTANQVAEDASYQIAALLLNVYQLKKFSLKPLVGLVTFDSKMVDFFAINRTELFNKKKQQPHDVIHHFGGLIQQWQEDRIKTAESAP